MGINLSAKLLDFLHDEKQVTAVNLLTALSLVNKDGISRHLMKKIFGYDRELVTKNLYLFEKTLAFLIRESFVVKNGDIIAVEKQVQGLTIDKDGLVKDILPWRKVVASIMESVNLKLELYNFPSDEEFPEIMEIWTNCTRDKKIVMTFFQIPSELAEKYFLRLQYPKIGTIFAKANVILLLRLGLVDYQNVSRMRNEMVNATAFLFQLTKKIGEIMYGSN